MADEKLLITKAQAGDPLAFEELISMHQKNIFSIAYRIAGNQEDASDMAQEVLIKIFRNLNQFKGNSKFSTWLYRVATNTCLDMRKKIMKHSAYSLDQELETDVMAEILEVAQRLIEHFFRAQRLITIERIVRGEEHLPHGGRPETVSPHADGRRRVFVVRSRVGNEVNFVRLFDRITHLVVDLCGDFFQPRLVGETRNDVKSRHSTNLSIHRNGSD